MSEGEGVFFYGLGAAETEVVRGDQFGELALDYADGFEVFNEGTGETNPGFAIIFRHDEGGSGEAVAASVQGGCLFAFFGFGTG
jgi:hypothetical protein